MMIWLISGDYYALADVFFLLLNMLINFGLRKFMGLVAPKSTWIYTPSSCQIACQTKLPGFLQQCGGVIDMPSFHAQMVGHYTLYWLLVLAYSVDGDIATVRKVFAIVLLLVLVYLLMYARFFLGCSTIPQLAVGFICGTIVGTLSFYLLHFLVKGTTSP